jgi:bifunctional enzyme CysN/CysC
MSLPSRRTSTVARLVTREGDLEQASAPMAVTVTLADEIDVSRGDMLVSEAGPPHVTRSVEAMVVWMNETPLRPGATYLLKHTSRLVSAEVREIHERVDVNTLERRPAAALGLNEIGRVTLHAARPLLCDAYAESRATGAFILVDRLTNGTFGAGMILRPGAVDAAEGGAGVSLAERERRLGQKAAVVTVRDPELAAALERALWDEGYTAHVLGPGEQGALAVCQRLGMISIVVADTGDATSTVASLLASLRAREVIRG